ncbi:hypothetical protein KIW84_034445 [Lathyrus oleraceus]|uniref:H15 domain-containing protein n=1 Tax=Pisum sativum TaxID=3888 RepID=A0A9D4Y189_PEA|nr:hypothetical protein KIW84_034445 [Pisum sativum]
MEEKVSKVVTKCQSPSSTLDYNNSLGVFNAISYPTDIVLKDKSTDNIEPVLPKFIYSEPIKEGFLFKNKAYDESIRVRVSFAYPNNLQALTTHRRSNQAQKTAAANKPLSHPTFAEMITEAITNLKERTGSSQYAETKFIKEKHEDSPPTYRKLVKFTYQKSHAKTNQNPPRAGKCVGNDDTIDETAKDAKSIHVESQAPQSDTQDQDNADNSAWLVDELQTMENPEYDGMDDILLCKEILDSSALFDDFGLDSITPNELAYYENKMTGNCNVANETSTSVLDTLELDTPPDYDLSNLTFCSQDTI